MRPLSFPLIVVGVLLAVVAAPAAGVADPPSLVLTPARGAPGAIVQASGGGWTPGQGPVQVYADAAEIDGGEPLAQQEPTVDGNFTVSFTLRGLQPGDRTFYACQLCYDPGGVPDARAAFEVLAPPEPAALVLVDPGRAGVGEQITVSGEGWSSASGGITLALVSAADESVATLSEAPAPDPVDGTFETTVRVPEVAAGDHSLSACQECSDPKLRREDTAPLVVVSAPTRAVVVTPRTGRPGETVSVSGVGWSPTAGDVSLYLDRARTDDPGSRLLSVAPGRGGRFDGVPLRVPDLEPGEHRWYACQRCGDPAAAPGVAVAFVVGRAPALSPQLVLDPASGEAGTTPRATGTGWSPARGEVSIFADRGHVSDPSKVLASAAVRGDGSFVTDVEIPEGITDRAELFACQDCGAAEGYPAALATFEIESAGTDGRNLLLAAAAVAALAAAAAAQRRAARRRADHATAPTGRPELRVGSDSGFRAAVADPDANQGERPALRLVPHDTPLAVLDPPEEM